MPLMRASAFGRGYLDLELILAPVRARGAIVGLRVERPERRQRPVAEMLALTGALLAAAAALLIPGLAGHAGQTSPRGVSVALDWLHLASGLGLDRRPDRPARPLGRASAGTRRLPGLSRLRPALLAGRVRLGDAADRLGHVGVGHPPADARLALADLLREGDPRQGRAARRRHAARLGEPARNTPRLAGGAGAARPRPPAAAQPAARCSSRGEVVLVAGAVFAAAVLSSLPPPPKALASIGAVERTRRARRRDGDRRARTATGSTFDVDPNRAAVPNAFSVGISKDGRPRSRAPTSRRRSPCSTWRWGSSPTTFRRRRPASTRGRRRRSSWSATGGSRSTSRPPGGSPFTVVLVDKANG